MSYAAALKKSKINHDGGDRKFLAVLYPDSEVYDCDEVLSNIMRYATEWAYIMHDRDIECIKDENGQDKQVPVKPHYHVTMRFETPRIRQTIANNIGIEKNYIERCITWKGANRYLIHADDDDKFQYLHLEVETNFEYAKLIGKKDTELGKVNELINYIKQEKCYTTIQLADFAREHDLWDAFRRNYVILRDYMSDYKIYMETKQKTEEEMKKRKEYKK